MPEQNISILLQLIDEWLESREDSQLSEDCRKSGQDFFSYMKSRGVYQGWMATVIQKATGYSPRKLWQEAEAPILRNSISRYEYSITIAKHTDQDPYDVIREQWR